VNLSRSLKIFLFPQNKQKIIIILRKIINATVAGDPAFNYFPILSKIVTELHSKIASCQMEDLVVVTSALSINPDILREFKTHKWFTDPNTGIIRYWTKTFF
jgi:hypothetical protein